MISIIFVDDIPELVIQGTQILEQQGDISVQTCSTAEEGLEYLKGHTCDAVVSGSHRPGMNGIAFFRAGQEAVRRHPFYPPDKS